MSEVLAAGAMALLAITSVGLWTLRVALTARGRRGLGATVAAIEAVIFAIAFTNVAAHLGSPVRVAGYAGGVALGTVLGLTADRRLSAGVSEVDIVVDGRDTDTAERLRQLGWPATTFAANGPSGPVTLICIAVDDTHLTDLTAAIRQVAPQSFWTIQPLGTTHASVLPDGYFQIAAQPPRPLRRRSAATNPSHTGREASDSTSRRSIAGRVETRSPFKPRAARTSAGKSGNASW